MINNQNNSYYQGQHMGQPMTPPPMPPQGQMMPPPPMPRLRGRNTWQQRFLSGNSFRPMSKREERSLPNWLVGKSVLFFFIAFALCTVVWGYPMELRYAIISVLSVLLFFGGCYWGSKSWAQSNAKSFIRNVFALGLVIRLIWVFYCYFVFNPDYYGTLHGDDADTGWYMEYGNLIAEWLRGDLKMTFEELRDYSGSAIDDVGYPVWLSIVNIVTFGESDVFVPFLIKCVIGAYCAICIYHVAYRHFGDGTARMAALFVALNPNIIYWCGTMFKEAEMVFLCCLCVDLVDKTFTSGAKLTFKSLLPGVLVGMYIFFFRSALAIVLFLAMFSHIVMASNRVMSFGKKIIAGVMVAIVLLVGMGDRLRSQAESIMENVQSDKQDVNMQWRATREGGNNFAKYASAAVFAPLIVTIPFPTFNVANESQILQFQLSGGYFIKNVFSYFVIYVMIIMLLSGEWRRHVFTLAYTLGYLACLVLSNFAQSGRFHMPIWPMLMLFAAYGIQLGKTTPRIKRWFPIVLAIEGVACLAWNWFKLAGRGMV